MQYKEQLVLFSVDNERDGPPIFLIVIIWIKLFFKQLKLFDAKLPEAFTKQISANFTEL